MLFHFEILTAIAQQLTAMLSHRSKVQDLRFDLHTKGPDNLELSRFMQKIKSRIQEHYKAMRLGYVWVREQERAQQHYHLALFIDANKVQHAGRLLDWIEQCWVSRGHPKPYIPENCFKVLTAAVKRPCWTLSSGYPAWLRQGVRPGGKRVLMSTLQAGSNPST